MLFLYIPLMAHNLLEAVKHAIVRVDAASLARLKLSVVANQSGLVYSSQEDSHSGLDNVQRIPRTRNQHHQRCYSQPWLYAHT